MKKSMALFLASIVSFSLLTTPAFSAENEGESGGSDKEACELTNSCPSPDPRPKPGPTDKPCIAESGYITLEYNGGTNKKAYGSHPGAPYPQLTDATADGWATIGGGWGLQNVQSYDITVSSLVGISWNKNGLEYIVWNGVDPTTGYSLVCTGIVNGPTNFSPVRDYSLIEQMLDGFCPTYVNGGYLAGPFERDNETQKDGFSIHNVNSYRTPFGNSPGINGTGWRWCYSADSQKASFDQPLFHSGRYLGPVLGLDGSYLVAYYTPSNAVKWGWVVEKFPWLVLGNTALDPNRSKYLSGPIRYLDVPGAFQFNCAGETTVAAKNIPGARLPSQVKWGPSNNAASSSWAQPLFNSEGLLPKSFQWTDSSPLYYELNYCATADPAPELRRDESPSVPDLTAQCVNARENPVMTLPNGATRSQNGSRPVEVRADGKTTRIDWQANGIVDVLTNAPVRNEQWLTRFTVPTTGVGKNSPSSIHTNNLNASERQPFGTVPFDEVALQNSGGSKTWEPLNTWLDGNKRGIGERFFDASVSDRYFATTPTWWWSGEVFSRTRTTNSISIPVNWDNDASNIAIQNNDTTYEIEWMPLQMQCTGREAGLKSIRVANVAPRL